jgi:multiple sugar transport system substrate-binding protein
MAEHNVSRRQFLKASAVALSGAVLAACGATPTPTAVPAAAPKPTTPPAPTAVPTAAAAPVTLKFACWDYELYGYDKALIEAFMKKYPNIKVDVTTIPNADYDNKINIMLSGGEVLDVLYAKSVALFGNLIFKNLLMDLKPLLDKDKVDLTPYGASIAAYMTMGNQILGLPYRYDRYLIYFNKDIFDAAKEPIPSLDLTWDDYRALALKLTKGTGTDKIYGSFFAPANYFFLTPGLQEGKGDYSTMDFNLFKEGWGNFYDMMYTDKSAQDWPSMKSVSADQTYFMKGTAAFTINGSWYMNTMKSEIDAGRAKIKWGAQRVPVSKAMKSAGVHASNASITPVVMTNKTKLVDASWTLLKYIASEEAGKIMASYLITPGYSSPAVVDAMAQVPGFDPTAKAALLASGAAYPAVSGANKNAGALSTMVNQQLELLFTKNQTLDKTISEMERLRKEILAQNP